MIRRLIRRRSVLIPSMFALVAAAFVAGATDGHWATGRPAHADAPVGWYTIMGTGATAIVTDTKTKLVWQQTAAATSMKWQDAINYCTMNPDNLPGSGWRLPSVNELCTLIDVTRTSAAIDSTFFPNAPGGYFWASSTAVQTGRAWVVDFASGGSGAFDKSTTQQVRCVR